MRDRIWNGVDGLEPEHAILVALDNASAIRDLSIFILGVVMTTRVRLPDVNRDPFDWLALGIFYGTEHQQKLTFGVVR